MPRLNQNKNMLSRVRTLLCSEQTTDEAYPDAVGAQLFVYEYPENCIQSGR